MKIDIIKTTVLRMINLHPNDDFAMEECWKVETDLLSENVSETIRFLQTQCTDEELYCFPQFFRIFQNEFKAKSLSKLCVHVLQELLAKHMIRLLLIVNT